MAGPKAKQLEKRVVQEWLKDPKAKDLLRRQKELAQKILAMEREDDGLLDLIDLVRHTRHVVDGVAVMERPFGLRTNLEAAVCKGRFQIRRRAVVHRSKVTRRWHLCLCRGDGFERKEIQTSYHKTRRAAIERGIAWVATGKRLPRWTVG